jgi:hypothetical protein
MDAKGFLPDPMLRSVGGPVPGSKNKTGANRSTLKADGLPLTPELPEQSIKGKEEDLVQALMQALSYFKTNYGGTQQVLKKSRMGLYQAIIGSRQMESDFTKSLSESKDDDHIHLLHQDFDEGMASKMLPIDPPGTTLLRCS